MFTSASTIEDIIESKPEAISLLMQKGIKCLVCGEPVWGNLEESAKNAKLNDNEIEIILSELNKL